MMHMNGLSTRCIHAGEIRDTSGSPHTPLYSTTTFAFDSTADLLDVVEGRRRGNLYSRYGLNPSILSLEEKLTSLEGAEAALAFSSGMAAESAAFFAHGRAGIICIGDAYGSTLSLLSSQLPQLGIPTHFLLADELERLEYLLEAGARLVFFETPTNPALEVFDIQAIAPYLHVHFGNPSSTHVYGMEARAWRRPTFPRRAHHRARHRTSRAGVDWCMANSFRQAMTTYPGDQ